MAKGDSCCCSADTAVTLACSGGSNVGQITSEVAKRLWSEGLANFFCLAGGDVNTPGASRSRRTPAERTWCEQAGRVGNDCLTSGAAGLTTGCTTHP